MLDDPVKETAIINEDEVQVAVPVTALGLENVIIGTGFVSA